MATGKPDGVRVPPVSHPDSPYELVVFGLETETLSVQSFTGREALSRCYEFDIEVLVGHGHRVVPDELIGSRATFSMHLTSPSQVHYGIIAEVTLIDAEIADRPVARYGVRLVPRLWLLTQRRRSRVFQDRTVREIVQMVLAETGLPAVWLLQHEVPKRPYCTQFEETDEAFVRRLTAEAGIFFFFLHPPAPPDEMGGALSAVDSVLGAAGGPSITGEVIVFADDPLAYHALGELPSGLEALLRAGLSEIGRAAGGMVGEVAGAASMAASVVRDLGGPDLSALASAGESRQLRYQPDADALGSGQDDVVRSLTVRDAVRSDQAEFRAYDWRRPMAQLIAREPPTGGVAGRLGTAVGVQLPEQVTEGAAVAGKVASAVGGALGSAGLSEAREVLGAVGHALGSAAGDGDLEVYDHHDYFHLPDWGHSRHEAKRILQSERRDRRVLKGRSLCPLLTCGRRFQLVDHPLEWVNREYALVEVTHWGRTHTGPTSAGGDAQLVYENELVCVPSDVPFVPRRPPRRTVQTCLTATVVGATDEIHTRDMAEVKVRFHWDREGHGTCWIRTMQAWSGAGWGSQFMPRVGMEVVVGFEGGDPDKPIVMGCVYNGTHPPPFALPENQTVSGIRTSSTPGGAGHNELSFEDRAGRERVYLHAERDLDIEVERDRHLHVNHDDVTRVENEQRTVVEGEQNVRIQGGQRIVVAPERRVEVDGTHEVVTRGTRLESVTGEARFEVRGALHRTVGGSSTEVVSGDVTRRTTGNVTELVGRHDGPRARVVRVEGESEISSAGPSSLASDEEVLVRCGRSYIRVSDARVEICSPEIVLAADGATARLGGDEMRFLADATYQVVADRVLLTSSGASLGLSSEASVDGARVLLNSPQSASDSVEPEEVEPTVIELTDQDGRPLAHQSYRIVLDDGSVRTGTLDENGRAEVELDGSAEVVFPDLGEVEPS